MSEQPLSLRAYAKHRGVSHQAVMKAIESGRLAEAVVWLNGVPKIADPELADREWDANTDLTRATPEQLQRLGAGAGGDGPPPDGDSIAASSAREKYWRALDIEIKVRTKAGELANAAELAAEVADAYVLVRTRLEGLPSKAKQRLPHLTQSDIDVLEAIVREALEGLVTEAGADA